jgi:phosphoglycolate phosphatase
VDACLFDVDGTLVDSTKPILQALNVALNASGLPELTASDLSRYVGPPLRELLGSLLATRGDDPALLEAVMHTFREVYQRISIEMAISYPEVPQLLAALRGRLRLGVVTSKPGAYAVPILEALHIAPLMEVIEGPPLSEDEPKTVTMARALDRLTSNGPLDTVAMVGDRKHDVEAAHSHGLRAIGVTWGFGTRSELAEAGADAIADTPAELHDLLALHLHA